MMDPASAAVAFVGFAASVATLCGLVIESSRTLYELQDKTRNAPDELRKLYTTLKSLESMLLEIQRRSLDLDNLSVSVEFRESWKATVSLLETAMASLQEWLSQRFGSLDLERFGRKKLLQRMMLFFADKKLEAFRRSIDEHISRLGFLQGLLISSQCQSLAAQYQVFPDLVSRLSEEIGSGTSSSLQIIQGIRSDISELRQTQLTAIETLGHTRGYHKERSGSIHGRHSTNRLPGRIARSLCTSGSSPQNRFRMSVSTEAQMLSVICTLPIGSLHYSRSHRKSMSTDADSGVTETTEQKSTISLGFIPASWMSNALVQLMLETCSGRDQTRTLSFRLKDPARICSDKDVIKSLGLLSREDSRKPFEPCCTMDPMAFRGYLLQGRVRPNDVLYSDKMQGVVSILEAVVANLLKEPKMAYQICEILVSGGARIDIISSDHGTPLYIASGGGLRVVSKSVGKHSNTETTIYFRGRNLESSELEDVKSIQRLLLQYNAAFDLHLPYGDERTAWSAEHGWLPRLLSLSHDPEYLRQVLFDNLDIFEIEDFGQCDKWLIGILCHTFPTLRAVLGAQLLPTQRSRPRSFLSELELHNIIEQVKAASTKDRCLLIGSICRFGTVAMLRPFLQGDFDLNERACHIRGLRGYDRHYFFQAAKMLNFDAMNALISAGITLLLPEDLIDIFEDIEPDQLCRKCDTVLFIDLVFAAFDFEGCQRKREILHLLFWRVHSLFRFEDPWLALSYISAGLIRRGCFFARPPISLDQILTIELFDIIRARWWPISIRKNWILHIKNQYKTNFESTAATPSPFQEDISFSVTALGLSVELDELELMQLFLDAGANVDGPIAGGRSALELAKENLQKAPRKVRRTGEWITGEKGFEMLIDALKSRGLHDIADQAILEVRQCPPSTNVQTTGIARRLRMMLDYLLAREPGPDEESFHQAIAEHMSTIRIITALNADGIFIRFGFLFSLWFVISFQIWTSLKDLISRKRFRTLVPRLIVVALLGLVIVLKFQYAESRVCTLL